MRLLMLSGQKQIEIDLMFWFGRVESSSMLQFMLAKSSTLWLGCDKDLSNTMQQKSRFIIKDLILSSGSPSGSGVG